jgi:Leucine-rich repeat (LRR) protein
MLQELSVSGNKLVELPISIQNLTALKILNIADNQLKALPESLGKHCIHLQTLLIYGNMFTSFPCTFLHLKELQEFGIEWFLYAKPPKPKLAQRKTADGEAIFESLY